MLNTSIGRDGALAIPVAIWRRLGLNEGAIVEIEEIGDGLMIRPAADIEVYSPQRKAEFLLNNAIGAEDYQAARAEVLAMGLDPDAIPHEHPA